MVDATRIRTLSADDFDAVHRAFVEAFSDYVVPFAPSREQLGEMLTRRGYVPEASVAAFDGDRIVAFTLNGVDGERAYDSGTGVVPSHRRQRFGERIMQASFDVLRGRGCREYLLEVIESNAAAHALYVKLGFRETRRFDCWRYSWSGGHPRPPGSPDDVGGRGRPPLQRAFRDVELSWQNSDASIARARDPHVILGDEDAYAILFPASGDLAQLAVRRDARRRGIGTRLLREAAQLAAKPLRILTIDDRDRGIAAFLAANGAELFVREIEMLRQL